MKGDSWVSARGCGAGAVSTAAKKQRRGAGTWAAAAVQEWKEGAAGGVYLEEWGKIKVLRRCLKNWLNFSRQR